MNPAISIITAVRNGAATIGSALESVGRQTVAAEQIVIDACSTDATLDVVARCAPRARVVSEPDSGIYDAMNKGIALAQGQIVGILNCDDYYPDETVLARVAELFSDPAVDCCYGDLLYVKGEFPRGGKVVRCWRSGRFAAQRFAWGWMPPHPTFFVRRSLYQEYGGFRLDLGTAADYELMLRFLVKHRARCRYIPHVMVHMRCGGASDAGIRSRLAANRMDRLAWRVNGLRPYPWTLTLKPLRKIPQYFPRFDTHAGGADPFFFTGNEERSAGARLFP